MSSRKYTLQQLVRLTCDAVADVLDTYREHHLGAIKPRLILDVQKLLATLEKYEEQILRLDSLELGVTLYPQRNTWDLLNNCELLAARLRLQIRRGICQDDDDVRREVSILSDGVTQLLAKTSGHDDTAYEVAELRSILDSKVKENEELKERMEELQGRMEVVEANDQSKLHHIKRLHAAVTGLGMIHPLRHRLNSWEELTEELPQLIDHIESTNELLKYFENISQSEPSSPTYPPGRPRPSSRENALWSSSPTDSNASSIEDSTARIRKAHRSGRRRTNGSDWRSSIWNQ
jgi:hypothetical protein